MFAFDVNQEFVSGIKGNIPFPFRIIPKHLFDNSVLGYHCLSNNIDDRENISSEHQIKIAPGKDKNKDCEMQWENAKLVYFQMAWSQYWINLGYIKHMYSCPIYILQYHALKMYLCIIQHQSTNLCRQVSSIKCKLRCCFTLKMAQNPPLKALKQLYDWEKTVPGFRIKTEQICYKSVSSSPLQSVL